MYALTLQKTPKRLETGLRTISAGIPYTLPERIEAIGFPTFGASTIKQPQFKEIVTQRLQYPLVKEYTF